MKTFKITVVAELQLPDDFDIQQDPVDGPILTRDGQSFMPVFQWLTGPLTVQPKSDERPWDNVDDETADLFIDATQGEECCMEQLKS